MKRLFLFILCYVSLWGITPSQQVLTSYGATAAASGHVFTFVRSSSPINGTLTTSPAITFDAGSPTVGNYIFLSVSGSQGVSGAPITGCTDDGAAGGNTYVVANSIQNATSNKVSVTHIFAKITAAGATTVTCTGGQNYYFPVAAEFSVTGSGNVAIDSATTGADTTNTTTVTCGTLSPTAGLGELIVAAMSSSTGGSVTSIAAGSGYTIPAGSGSHNPNVGGGTTSIGAGEYQIIMSTSGTYAPTFIIGTGTSIFQSCVGVAYK